MPHAKVKPRAKPTHKLPVFSCADEQIEEVIKIFTHFVELCERKGKESAYQSTSIIYHNPSRPNSYVLPLRIPGLCFVCRNGSGKNGHISPEETNAAIVLLVKEDNNGTCHWFSGPVRAIHAIRQLLEWI